MATWQLTVAGVLLRQFGIEARRFDASLALIANLTLVSCSSSGIEAKDGTPEEDDIGPSSTPTTPSIDVLQPASMSPHPGAHEQPFRPPWGYRSDLLDVSKLTDDEIRLQARAAEAPMYLGRLGVYAAEGNLTPGSICDLSPAGSEPPTPPLDVDCNRDPDKTCVAVATKPSAPGEYPSSVWNRGAWEHLGFEFTRPHSYHYSITWNAVPDDEDYPCHFTITAQADLDGDGIWSKINYIRPPYHGPKGEFSLFEIWREFE